MLHDKANGRAMCAAAEAMIKLLGLTDGKGRGFFVVERAAGDVVGASLLERHMALDHVHDIDAVQQVLDKTFRNHARTALTSRQLLKDFRHAGETRNDQAGLIWIIAL